MIIMPSLVLDKNTSEVLNVNADTIATELAINLSASKLIFISDVPFIKDTQGERISTVDENVSRKLFYEKIISNGMIVKVENSLKALNMGVQKIHIISGEIKNALLLELETEAGIGTVFHQWDHPFLDKICCHRKKTYLQHQHHENFSPIVVKS